MTRFSLFPKRRIDISHNMLEVEVTQSFSSERCDPIAAIAALFIVIVGSSLLKFALHVYAGNSAFVSN